MAQKSTEEFYNKVYELANYSLDLYNEAASKGEEAVDKLFKDLDSIPGLRSVYEALAKIDI